MRRWIHVAMIGLVFCLLAGLVLMVEWEGPSASGMPSPDGGVLLKTEAPDLWWGSLHHYPEDDDLPPSAEQREQEARAGGVIKLIEAAGGVTAPQGKRAAFRLHARESLVLAEPVHNRGGPAASMTLELSGTALAGGLVEVREVTVHGRSGSISLPGDGGGPTSFRFPIQIGAGVEGEGPVSFSTGVDPVDHARQAVFQLAVVARGDAGTGVLVLRVSGSPGGPVHVRREEIIVE